MSDRVTWMRTDGTPRSIVTAHRVIDDIAAQEVPVPFCYDRGDYKFSGKKVEEALGKSGVGFAMIILELQKYLHLATPYDKLAAQEQEHLGTTFHNNKFMFGDGLADQHFTWHMGGAVAANLAQQFANDGLIDRDDMKQATLSDWADIIGSQWFSDLLHDLAVAPNGFYGNYGAQLVGYTRKAPFNSRTPYTGKVYDSSVIREKPLQPELEDLRYAGVAARLSQEARHLLRSNVRTANNGSNRYFREMTIGCPVARRSFETDEQRIQQYGLEDIAQSGVKRFLNIRPAKRTDRYKVDQTLTPIDRYLLLLSDTLVDIDTKHGSPILEKDGSISYQRRPQRNVFAWVEE